MLHNICGASALATAHKQISHTGMCAANERKHLVRKRLLWRRNLMAYQLFVLQTVRRSTVCVLIAAHTYPFHVLRQLAFHSIVFGNWSRMVRSTQRPGWLGSHLLLMSYLCSYNSGWTLQFHTRFWSFLREETLHLWVCSFPGVSSSRADCGAHNGIGDCLAALFYSDSLETKSERACDRPGLHRKGRGCRALPLCSLLPR